MPLMIIYAGRVCNKHIAKYYRSNVQLEQHLRTGESQETHRKLKCSESIMQKSLGKITTGPTGKQAAAELIKKQKQRHKLTDALFSTRLTRSRRAVRVTVASRAGRDNLSRNISHFTAPSHFGQQASIGMFLLPLTQFAKSGERGGEQPSELLKKHRGVFCAARGDREENKNVYTRSLNAIPVLSRKAVDDDPELSFFLFLLLL